MIRQEAGARRAPESHNPDSGASATAPRRLPWIGWVGSGVLVAAIWPVTFGGLAAATAVATSSMQPSLAAGDLVITLRQAEYQVGDVVAYRSPDGGDGQAQPIARIAEIEGTGADRSYAAAADATIDSAATLAPGDIVGLVVLRVPGGGVLLDTLVVPFEIASLAALAVLVAVRLVRPVRRAGPS